MTSLRQRMIEDMQVRNLAIGTQDSYVQHVALFARHFNKSPELLGPEQIRAYQVYLTNEKKLATASITIAVGNRHRKEKLEHCRQLLDMAPPKDSSSEPATPEDYRDRYEKLTGRSLRECPVCHRGRMITVRMLAEVRASPAIQDTS
jgi:hypothetical protein